MGFVIEAGATDEPWIRAIIERYEWLKGKPDVGIGYWTAAEWGDLEHLHRQHHRQQQHQQRQIFFRYRQQQQHQHQHQYHFQQQHETFRRQQHLEHYQPETAKKNSKARVEARADREEASAEIGSAPPSSQTTLKPQSLSEYSAMVLSMSQLAFREDWSIEDAQLESMENGLLRKTAKKEEEELVEESKRPQQSLQAAQPRPCPPVEGVGGDEMGVLGEELVVAGCGAGVEEQRPPFWEDSDISVWWPVPGETELETRSSIARFLFSFGGCDVDDGTVVVGDGSLVFEDGEQAPPPLLQQQQQEPLAFTPQEPWPPPMMAAEHESGGGGSGESRLELVGGSIARLNFSFDCGSGGLGGGHWESDRPDGSALERDGIGTGARSRDFWGCEVVGRRPTRQRRAQVREK